MDERQFVTFQKTINKTEYGKHKRKIYVVQGVGCIIHNHLDK
jgi:hypothetical protein